MCTIAPRLVSIGRHKDIEILTLSEVESIEGEAGHFRVRIKRQPRYVDESRCTGCGSCAANCPIRLRPQPLDGARPDLPPEMRAAVDGIIAEQRRRPGHLLLILQSLNALYNYFPEAVLRYVAHELQVPLTQVLRIATFYNSFSLKPRGKHTINVCMGTTCYVRNGERIIDRFSEILEVPVEETTRDMQFTLKAVRCVGCCSIAPVAMIDGKAFGRLKLNDVPAIVKRYSGNGQFA